MLRFISSGLVLAAGYFLGSSDVFVATPASGAEPSAARPASRVVDARVVEWVRYCTAQRQPTASERQIDQIGWAGGIREAMRLSRQHQRPVFLFTHDGRMNVGHC